MIPVAIDLAGDDRCWDIKVVRLTAEVEKEEGGFCAEVGRCTGARVANVTLAACRLGPNRAGRRGTGKCLNSSRVAENLCGSLNQWLGSMYERKDAMGGGGELEQEQGMKRLVAESTRPLPVPARGRPRDLQSTSWTYATSSTVQLLYTTQ